MTHHIMPTLLAAAVVAAVSPAEAMASRPNIVVILADDLGFGDVQANNPDSDLPTPHLNRLAKQGTRFVDAHTPSSVCTPTRYGLLTGRYCWRSRLKSGVLNGYGTPLIERDRPTIASFLKTHGYKTGIVGKWHLGLDFTRLPTTTPPGQTPGKKGPRRNRSPRLDFSKPILDGPNRRGFEESFIIPASLDFPPYVYIHNTRITSATTIRQPAVRFPGFLRQGPRAQDLVMAECLDHLARQATGFIDQQARSPDTPFFLYFPLTAPHKPVLPHPRFRGSTRLGPYGDFVAQVDSTIGAVLDCLDRNNLTDKTLVICTSDNGSFMHRRDDEDAKDHVDDPSIQAFRDDRHRANGRLRGTKADIWEAGHRVPFIARWPGRVAANTTNVSTICLTDVMATLADLIDKELPPGAGPDSYSFLQTLTGSKEPHKRPAVIHHSVSGMFAIREGKWKLVLGNGSGGRQVPRGRPFARPYFLADLETDPSETTNLVGEYPEVARRLEKLAERIRRGPLPQ